MKYVLLASVCIFSLGTLSAQQNQKGINLNAFIPSLSFEPSYPILAMKGSLVGLGIAGGLGYPIINKLVVSVTFGYTDFISKKKTQPPAEYEYLFAGAKYYLLPAVHVDVFAGYATFKGTAIEPLFGTFPFDYRGFGFAIGAGYKVSDHFDASIRFQKSKTVSFIGLSLAYLFGK